jgi:hypothetical protein
MFFILDVRGNAKSTDTYQIHRAYPLPCIYLPHKNHQVYIGDHENPSEALLAAKELFPVKKIIFCSRCYGRKRSLSAEELEGLISIFN